MGAFDHLEWTYEWGIGLGSGEFEQKFSKNSNARGVARGGMLKLRFDWYISNIKISNLVTKETSQILLQRLWHLRKPQINLVSL